MIPLSPRTARDGGRILACFSGRFCKKGRKEKATVRLFPNKIVWTQVEAFYGKCPRSDNSPGVPCGGDRVVRPTDPRKSCVEVDDVDDFVIDATGAPCPASGS